ncbi:MAG: hypothetical protein U9N84_07780 [Actinomycetota bacterium]|nr:hypothetical protein [Actinomycetota bacterium]
MLDLHKLARRTFSRHLENHEEVLATANATAAGMGGILGSGLVLGILGGTLYAITISTAAALPYMVLGGFVGIIGGIVVAEATARRPPGPGAMSVKLVVTNRRLLVLRQQAAIRLRPLRIFRLDEVDAITVSPSPIRTYQRTGVHLADGQALDLHVAGHHNFVEFHREQSGDFEVD